MNRQEARKQIENFIEDNYELGNEESLGIALSQFLGAFEHEAYYSQLRAEAKTLCILKFAKIDCVPEEKEVMSDPVPIEESTSNPVTGAEELGMGRDEAMSAAADTPAGQII
ncbi:MAG: hypothetical protein MI923_19285 [Phycisphaerales bacterium]|nr:hypothetical protein [Phycisphaerales bacterium]